MLGFLVITRTRYLRFGPDLVGIFPRSLPQLSKQLRDHNNSQKCKKKRHLEIMRLMFFIEFDDSRYAQLSIYTVFHEESEFEVEHANFLQLDVKNEEKRNE